MGPTAGPCQRQKVPLSFSVLRSYPKVDGVTLELVRLSKELWGFLRPMLVEAPYHSRIQKAGGGDRNGLELWRDLFREHEGGAEQVALGGLGRLHRVPQCPAKQHLGHYLGELEYLRTKYGRNLPDACTWAMLMNVLPEEIQK